METKKERLTPACVADIAVMSRNEKDSITARGLAGDGVSPVRILRLDKTRIIRVNNIRYYLTFAWLPSGDLVIAAHKITNAGIDADVAANSGRHLRFDYLPAFGQALTVRLNKIHRRVLKTSLPDYVA